MKSYLLFGISDAEIASRALDRVLSHQQRSPWLLRNEARDVVAYFDVWPTNLDYEGPDDPNGPGPMVTANISGRHFHEDAVVISVLKQVQADVGGLLKNDDEEVIPP